ncbi:beta-galactosidase [Algimonas porphyrae]|uniref:Beta-galactosidase n=1 Tax=Algimonas porphyrae TaxID=1128113 RepID=A0ABQ5V562_9PROT|nr:beta-galactosidase [Algimonas porphyrae]GLQ21412.1 beta-galactosidase [Algimonas porphyrae]
MARTRKPELGVCYYPEHWPETIWADDAQRMVEMGLSWVRIGEFAWSRIETEPGQFEWGWLDRAIKTLGQAGLKVIMSTPTATPPRWMLDRHPDMLAWDAAGRPRTFGSRRHYDFSHAGYRDEAVRITSILGSRYGRDPHIRAWQLDNEYGCHDTTLSYSPVARNAFHSWLEDRYGSIDALNERWGNVFWSMDYQAFDQIELPNLTVTEPNPSHAMDFRRFASDQVVAFNQAKVDALRPLTDAELLHNYMGRITDFDHFDVGQPLDIATWDSYPLGFLEDRSDRDDAFKYAHMRCGDPDFQAFHHDLYRAVGRGRWWVLEQQPGPVNWAPHNPAPAPGMVRLWALEAFAHGAEVVCFFRWRQAPFAQEQNHAGLLRPDGELSEGGREITALAAELDRLPGDELPPARVAIVFDYASQWAWEVQPQDRQFDYFRLVFDIYCGLRRAGLAVDILPPSANNFGDRDLVFIPGLFAWTDALRGVMQNFTERTILGPRTGSRTEDFSVPDDLPPGLSGITVSAVETLRPEAPIELAEAGSLQIWSEQVSTDWVVLERALDDRPVRLRQGTLDYWTGWPDAKALDRWIAQLCEEAGLAMAHQSGSRRIQRIAQGHLAMDYITSQASFIE